MEKKKRRWPLILLIVVALLAGGGATGYFLTSGKPQFAQPSTSASPEPSLAPVLAPIGQASNTSAAAGRLREALDPLMSGTNLGSNVNASVVDLRTGAVVYDHRGTVAKVPASNAKIVTAAAVLATRGAAYRITTKAVAGATPGEVVLVGSGDVTLSGDGPGYYDGAGSLRDLAEQIKKSPTPPTKVIVDVSIYSGPLLGPAWDPDEHLKGFTSKIIPLMIDGGRTDVKDKVMPFVRYDDPEIAAGKALARLLGVPEDSVVLGQAPLNAVELGAVQSAPMLRQLEQMLAESDNTLAEAMARQVALARNKPASFEGGAAATQEVLIELGLPADQVKLADGAGYSRQNQLSPAILTGVLRLSADGKHPKLADLINALPVAGWSGSMATRFGEPDATAGRGVVRAKSGTLTGINSISGVVQTGDGGLYAFSVLADQVPTWQLPAQVVLDRIVARIAACGC